MQVKKARFSIKMAIVGVKLSTFTSYAIEHFMLTNRKHSIELNVQVAETKFERHNL